jgi:hypothetical protein
MKDNFKHYFGYTASTLADNINIEGTELLPTLVETSDFLQKVTIEEDVPAGSTKEVKLLDADPELQEMTDCSVSASGGFTFTKINLTAKRLTFKMSFCNNDLNGKSIQKLLPRGAKNSLMELPAEQQLLALAGLKMEQKIQNLIFKGDTGSGDSELTMFDGLIKKWKNDPTIPAFANAGAVSASNAYTIFKGVSRAVATEVRDNRIFGEILCSEVDFNHLVDDLMADNNFHYTAAIQGDGNGKTLQLPGTMDTVRVVPQLSTGEIYFVPYQYIAVSTNLISDMNGVESYYVPQERTLYVETIMDLGVNYAYGKYFAKYDEANS